MNNWYYPTGLWIITVAVLVIACLTSLTRRRRKIIQTKQGQVMTELVARQIANSFIGDVLGYSYSISQIMYVGDAYRCWSVIIKHDDTDETAGVLEISTKGERRWRRSQPKLHL